MNISLFDDKPTLLDLEIKSEILCKLSCIKIEELLNLVIHGNNGVGKTTQIYAFLATILDKRIYDLKNIYFEEDKKAVSYKSSLYHIEIDAVSLGSNEKFFMQNFLKSYIETKNVGLNIFKIVLIKNGHLLSKQTQLSLRKTIESSSLTTRFIFEVSNLSNFSQALISRSVLIRIPTPSFEMVKSCLISYSNKKKYEISELSIDEIIKDSCKLDYYINLKRVFGFYRYFLFTKKKFKFIYYEKFEDIYNYIINKKISFINLQKIRDLVNELYIDLIQMKDLLLFLFNKFYDSNLDNPKFIYKLLEITVDCDINLNKGNKECLHLEYYIIYIVNLIHDI